MNDKPLEKIIRRGVELLDAHDVDGVMALFHPDCKMVMPAGEELDLDGIAAMFRMQIEGFPDVKHEVLQVVEAGDRIAFVSRFGGTHRGTVFFPEGPLEPTGRTVSVRACDVVTFRGDKIAHWNAFFDLAGMANQLGV
jgi:predicted ester cyclase